jgi:hypothetical protein
LARKEIIMQEIAFALHSGKIGAGEELKEATSKEFIPIIERVLKRFGMESTQAELLFQKLVNRTGLIVVTERYKDLFGFSHLTFQEFYTAKYLHDNGIDVFTAIQQSTHKTSENVINWWREVILLHSGMQKDTSQIIRKLCRVEKQELLGNLQIAAQCFSEAVEAPIAEVEHELLTSLLVIRTNGKSPKETRTFSPYVKQYLLRFATNKDFYEHALLTAVHNVQTLEEAKKLIYSLLSLTQSVDSNVQTAALKSIIELMESHDLSAIFDRSTIEKLPISEKLDFQLLSLKFIDSKLNKTLDGTFVSQFFERLIKSLTEEVARYPYLRKPIDNVQLKVQIFHEIMRENSKIKHSEVKEWLIDVLYKVLNSSLRYRTYAGPFELSFRKYLTFLLGFLMEIDAHTQDELYKQQLLEMLLKGSRHQQVWAIFLLGDIWLSDSQVINSIIDKLEAPFSEVRLAAISAFRHLKLSESHQNLMQAALNAAFKDKTQLKKMWYKIRELITGEGALGINMAERIQIAGTLFTLSNSKDESAITNLLTDSKDFYPEIYEWKELLDDLNMALNETNIERIISFSEKLSSSSKISPDMTVTACYFYQNNMLDILRTIADFHLKYDVTLRNRLISILLQNIQSPTGDKTKTLLSLKRMNPIIKDKSEEHQLMLDLVSNDSLDIAKQLSSAFTTLLLSLLTFALRIFSRNRLILAITRSPALLDFTRMIRSSQ